MAVENGVQNAELGYLLFPFEQYSNLAGKPLVGGHMEIYEAGTDTKYISYQNWDGAENPFKIPLPADGRITVLADPTKTFDCYLYDSYNNLVCSRLNVQANVPGNISIKGADTIIKNTDGTLDISLRTLGNNVREYTVNTNNKLLDVQEPLYFVENSQTATIIGFSGDNYVQKDYLNDFVASSISGKMDESKLEFNSHDEISAYNGSAFAGGQGDPEVNDLVHEQSATWNEVTAKADASDLTAYQTIEGMTAYQPSGDYVEHDDLSALDDKFISYTNKPVSGDGIISADGNTLYIKNSQYGSALQIGDAVKTYQVPIISYVQPLDTFTGNDPVSPQLIINNGDISSYGSGPRSASEVNRAPFGVLSRGQFESRYATSGSNAYTVLDTIYSNLGMYNTITNSASAASASYWSKLDAGRGDVSISAGSGYGGAPTAVYSLTAIGNKVASAITGVQSGKIGIYNNADVAFSGYAHLGGYVFISGANLNVTNGSLQVNGGNIYAHSGSRLALQSGSTISAEHASLLLSQSAGISGTSAGISANDWVTTGGIKLSDMTAYQPTSGMTAYQPSGDYADATALDGKVDTSSFSSFSSTTNEHIEYLSAALSGTYELSAGSGIDITDYPNEQKTVISVTAQGGNPEVEQAVIDNSATWNTVSDKLDTTAFSDVSGSFLTTIPNTYLQNTDLSTADGKITAISGIPLSAGGNVAVYTDAALPNSTQLDADIAAGKAICIVYDGRNYWFDRKSSDYYFYGADAYSTYLYYLSFRPENNSWTRGQKVLATQSWVTAQGYLTGVDLTPYQTTADMVNYQPVSSMTAYQSAGDYATTAQLANKLDTTAFSTVSGNFLTAHQDLSNYATTAQVADKLDTTAFSTVSGDFLTAHQDLSDYQTTAGMTAYQPVGSYLTADALDNVSANWNEVSAKLDTTAFSDVSGTFLTAHQDISNKLDTTAFSDVSGSFLTAVPDTYLQNTDLTIVDNKITEISGVPLSAGDELPEGLMNTSALEYNAVNEISGYNGSAIAQYGAEKQWLTHDDTIVHVSNSAQYAFGVNLSAISADLARMMGVDETELLVSTAASAFTLSEPVTSFNKLEIKVNWWNKNPNYYYPVQIFDTGNIRVAGTYCDAASDGSPVEVFGFNWTATNGLNYTLAKAFAKFASVGGWGGDNTTPDVLSVRGIGRKS